MEDNLIPIQSNIYKDAARSFVYAEVEKIDSILNQNYPEFIKNKCRRIRSRLYSDVEKIWDQTDLLEFRSLLDFAAELIDTFLTSNQSKSSWWAMALINECYDRCGISRDDREILIIHYLNSSREGYRVFPDLLSLPGLGKIISSDKIVDIFYIPSEAKHDIASIALIGHEFGHIYWSRHYKEIAGVINEAFSKKTKEDLWNFTELGLRREKIASHIEEFLCDKIGRYLLGPAFDFALLKLFVGSQNNGQSLTHPPEKSRIERSLQSLDTFQTNETITNKAIQKLGEYFEELRKECSSDDNDAQSEDEKFSRSLADSMKLPGDMGNPCTIETINENWDEIVPELDAFRPPFEKVSLEKPKAISPISAVIITSLYYYGKQFKSSNEYYIKNDKDEASKEEVIRTKLVEHLRYAISLYDFVKGAQEKYCGVNFDAKMIHPTLWSMRERVTEAPNPFVVIPSTSPASQYSSASVDLRLGNSFLVNKTTRYTHITPHPHTFGDISEAVPLDAFYDDIFIPTGSKFILHPHQFVLAATLEYVSLPSDFYGLVMGRSSWGRLGLNIATATAVHSGFRGCVTLELRNLGETPLPLHVGLRIAQLCLVPVPTNQNLKGYFATSGKYIGPVGPEVPKIKDDSDWQLLEDLQEKNTTSDKPETQTQNLLG